MERVGNADWGVRTYGPFIFGLQGAVMVCKQKRLIPADLQSGVTVVGCVVDAGLKHRVPGSFMPSIITFFLPYVICQTSGTSMIEFGD